MKLLLIIALTPLLTSRANCQSRLTAGVSGFTNNKGVCRACVFANAGDFSKGAHPVRCAQATIQDKKAILVFENLPPGTYALSLFHDENNNNQFDKNFLGIPKEGYGASGNRLPFAAAPGFNENQFELQPNSSLSLHISLRYLF